MAVWVSSYHDNQSRDEVAEAEAAYGGKLSCLHPIDLKSYVGIYASFLLIPLLPGQKIHQSDERIHYFVFACFYTVIYHIKNVYVNTSLLSKGENYDVWCLLISY